MKRSVQRTIFGLTLLAIPAVAHAENRVWELRFEHHRFSPATLTVPAGRALAVRVVNADKETIEFESFKLNREVVMTPGEAITVRFPALSPGSYDFYDDFHQDVPEGELIAK